MKIRNRIALQFSVIVASILLFFSLIIYLNSASYRQEEFYERLKSKARTTVRFLIEVNEVDKTLLKIIDRNTLTALLNEKVLIFDERNQLIYASVDDQVIRYDPALLDQVREQNEVETRSDDNELVGIYYTEAGQKLVVLASAYDEFGRSKLRNLGFTLLWGLWAGITLTVLLGIYFAGQSLEPINRINRQVQTITAHDLHQRLDEGNRRDEIDQLAVNFNGVLDRLSRAFDQQRSFVSHASHELRTPLAALKSEIQLAKNQPLTVQAYEQMLDNLMEDTERLIGLTNSLLFLARTLESSNQMPLTTLRLEDIVFEARDELLATFPDYQVLIDYDNLPETETETLLEGNSNLLRRVIFNLLDNACKYSPDRTARVRIGTGPATCRVAVADRGIGIPVPEQERIFEPFRRASNAYGYQGFGIGLSICRRIIELHKGRLLLQSTPGEGSTFTLVLPHR